MYMFYILKLYVSHKQDCSYVNIESALKCIFRQQTCSSSQFTPSKTERAQSRAEDVTEAK